MSPRHAVPCSLLLALLASSCATHTPLACPAQPRTRTAHVLFATDRRQNEPEGRKTAVRSLDFGPGRTDPPALQMGFQDVTLGPKHRLGVLDEEVKLAPAEIRTAPQSLVPQRTDAAINAFATTTIRNALRASPPPAGQRREVLLYIHGYNDTFDFAVRKTAQLAADLEMVTCDGKTRGLPVTYSWPAQGTFLSYLADEENAEWTQPRLVPLLKALAVVAQQEGADLHLVAHSMGARVLVRSLSEIASSGLIFKRGRPPFSQVILLAPDIGRELFTQYSERMLPLVGHVTIYVNAKDRALALSSVLHGGHHRLGLIESTISAALRVTGISSVIGGSENRDLAMESQLAGSAHKIDMIDVTGGITDFVGHSYEDPAFIHDLKELIYHHTPAGKDGRANLTAQQVRPGLFGLLGQRLNYFQLKKSE